MTLTRLLNNNPYPVYFRLPKLMALFDAAIQVWQLAVPKTTKATSSSVEDC